MSHTQKMRRASHTRCARRSLVELTAAASRAVDDGLFVLSSGIAASNPRPEHTGDKTSDQTILARQATAPSPADIEAAVPTLIAIRRLNRRFAFVLNQTPPRGCRLSEAATSLNSLGVLALPYVGQRNDHQDALGTGLGVTEFAQEGKASEEVRELWRWVLKKLVEGSLDHEPRAKKAAC